VLLDLPIWRCAWRALRRARERSDFWRWLMTWRRRYRPRVVEDVARYAPTAQLLVVRHPDEARRLAAQWPTSPHPDHAAD